MNSEQYHVVLDKNGMEWGEWLIASDGKFTLRRDEQPSTYILWHSGQPVGLCVMSDEERWYSAVTDPKDDVGSGSRRLPETDDLHQALTTLWLERHTAIGSQVR